MAKWPKSTAQVFDADALVTTHPAWLHSVTVCASVAGSGVSVYEGQDATSGRRVAHVDANANVSNGLYFSPPLWCQRGIYLDIETNVDHVTVHYTPQSLNQPEGD